MYLGAKQAIEIPEKEVTTQADFIAVGAKCKTFRNDAVPGKYEITFEFPYETDDDTLKNLPIPKYDFTLDIGTTRVTNAGIKYLKRLHTLISLNLSLTAVNDSCIDDLIECKRLQELFLFKARITEAGVKKIRKKLPNCLVCL